METNEEDFGYPSADITLFRDTYAVLPAGEGKMVYFYDFKNEIYNLPTEFDVNTCDVHPKSKICVLAGGIDAKRVTTTLNVEETLVT